MESNWWIWHISRSYRGYRGDITEFSQEPVAREAKQEI